MDTKETLKISGMSCAACSARIEKRLAKKDGIKTANVNLAMEKATIEFDASEIKLSDIIKTVQDLGYGAEKQEEVSRDAEKEQREKEIHSLRLNLIISATLAAPLLLGMKSFVGI